MGIKQDFWNHVDDVLSANEMVMHNRAKFVRTAATDADLRSAFQASRNRVSTKRAINNSGDIMPQACHDIFVEARGWIADCFEDAPEDLSDGDVIKAINEHYEGGWHGFVADQA